MWRLHRLAAVSSRRLRWSIRDLALPVAIVVASCSGCASTRAKATDQTKPPLPSLRDAVNAVLTASNFTIVSTEAAPLLPLPTGGRKTVTKAVIDNPDRVLISGHVIAIGSTGYFRGPPGKWTVVRHAGESTDFMNGLLLYLHLLERATSVVRHGDTYVLPPGEVARLLASTRLPELHNPAGATWSAIVRAGSLQSMTLRYQQPPQSTAGNCGTTSCTLPASPVTITTEVSRVGTSPTINPPAKDSLVSS